MTEVDLFVSTQRIKVLTADTQVSREREHPRGFGAAETFPFGLGISALHPCQWDRAQGWPTGKDTCLGGDTSLRSHPTQMCRVPRLSAWLHEASHANCASRELLCSQTSSREPRLEISVALCLRISFCFIVRGKSCLVPQQCPETRMSPRSKELFVPFSVDVVSAQCVPGI